MTSPQHLQTAPTRSQLAAMTRHQDAIKDDNNKRCACLTCRPRDILDESSQFFRVCPTCGNKRCPRCTDHRNDCTNSNELGQPSSIYSVPSRAQVGRGNTDEETS